MTKDRVTGIMALILGVIIGVMAFQLPQSKITGDVGPRVFPFLSSGILVICGAGLLIRGGKEGSGMFDRTALKRLGLIFLVVLVYCIAMNYIGFLVPTAVVLFVLSTMFAEGKQVAWWKRALYALVITAGVYLLFHNVLNLKLPANRLF